MSLTHVWLGAVVFQLSLLIFLRFAAVIRTTWLTIAYAWAGYALGVALLIAAFALRDALRAYCKYMPTYADIALFSFAFLKYINLIPMVSWLFLIWGWTFAWVVQFYVANRPLRWP